MEGMSERSGERQRMVAHIERLFAATADRTGLSSLEPRVKSALESVPRHVFVPVESRALAYADRPLPIGHGQTISQPYIVALMTQLAAIAPGDRVLEVGTGCGYQAAILSRLAAEVWTIEIEPELAGQAMATLARLGCANVHARCGDGHAGWPEAAPFDAIVVAAAPDRVPEALQAQLAPGGRMIIPVGGHEQHLMLSTKEPDGRLVSKAVIPVRFVPLTRR